MCFSANASFAASGVLAAVGAASIRENKTKRGLMYASIPLLFAVQQLIEGFQWLSQGPGFWSMALAYGFLFFAVILWPVYVPVAVYLIEPQPQRKKRLGYFIMLGAIVALYSLVCLFINPISVSAAACCHIHYGLGMPFGKAIGVAYVVATCGALFFSGHRWIRNMGVVAFIALVVSYLYASFAVISVWCFFSAALSVLVLVHERASQRV
jgi:hypothetical protein